MRNDKVVCVIGGGPIGVALGKALNEVGIDYDLYEAESDFGGVWNGSAKCGRVYSSLHLISPKFNTQFPDYPMPEDYPHYPNHRLMLNYIRSYARQFNVYKNAHFNTGVTRIGPADDAWKVELSTGEEKEYALVCVCNGLQRVSRYPHPPYVGEFSGEVIHSMDYKTPEQIKGKRVLIIGGGNSGCDIAIDAVHHSEKTYHSMRRGYYFQPKFIAGKPTPQWMMELGSKFETKEETLAYIKQVYKLAGYDGTDYGLKKPDYPLDAVHPIMNSQILYHIGHGDIESKEDVTLFRGKTVTFADGSEVEVDSIICATGYNRQFPFLDSKYLEWQGEIPDLFLHIIPKNLNNLLFLGYVNTAAGLGDATKTTSQLVVSYVNAYKKKSRGYHRFLLAKKEDSPEFGQEYYLDTYRHSWEVDLWKYLACMRKYQDMLDER